MTISDLRGIAQRVRTMRGRVEVGVPAGPTEADGASVATIAAVHEFGAHVAPHSRIHGQTLWQNPRTGRLVGRNTRLSLVHEIKAKPATFASGITIPARSFLRTGIEKNLDAFRRLNAANLKAVAEGSMTLDTALGKLGAAGASAVQAEIANGDFKPLRPATIRRKGSSKPLIDSGNLRQSVTWRIAKGGR